MATRKQRRRRQKDRRHEWEYVYVDDAGQEVEVEEDEAAPRKPAKQAAKASARPAAKGGSKIGPGRKVEPPSWNRVLKRGVVFAPVMLLVIYFLKPEGAATATLVVQLVVLLGFFMPFSYFMDSLMYRAYRKRIGDPLPPRQRPPRKS